MERYPSLGDKLAGSSLIHLHSVSRVFPRGQVAALRDVTLDIRAGDYTAITGPSGSGKSTLLCLAGGLDCPTQGRVLFRGREPGGPREWTNLRARHIGFVFQSFQLIGRLSAADNVEIPMFGVSASSAARQRRIAELLEAVGIDHRAGQQVADLSGGERQRVAIARALVNGPDVILADEPTGNLDSHSACQILDLLEGLHRSRGVTLVIVSHDPNVSRRAGRVVRLLDGQVVADEVGGGAS